MRSWSPILTRLDVPPHGLGIGEALPDMRQPGLLQRTHRFVCLGPRSRSVGQGLVDGVEYPVDVGKEGILRPGGRVRQVIGTYPQYG